MPRDDFLDGVENDLPDWSRADPLERLNARLERAMATPPQKENEESRKPSG
jgi:hypothetical protein